MMTYTSLLYALFVAAALLVYYLLPVRKYQWVVLLAASMLFYLINSYRYAFYIFLTSLTIWLCARIIGRRTEEMEATVKANKKVWSREERKAYKAGIAKQNTRLMAAGLLLNFGILFILKYYGFLAGSLNSLITGDAAAGVLPVFRFALPLGISFYTFQAAGYLIDINRGTIRAEQNYFRFLLFVSFFPQIVQGPISTFAQLGHQLTESHQPEWNRFKLGGELILYGLFKKLVLADRALIAINTVLEEYTQFDGLVILFTGLLYALQIYMDFSAGIDISRGVAKMFGIDMEINFRRPYFSKSLGEYWRRWHITLGAWMKNYVFYSLAMSPRFLGWSKKMKEGALGKTSWGAHVAKVLPTAFASFIVFFLVGIWHGANSKWIGFGIWNGGIIMLSILLKPAFDRVPKALGISTDSFGHRLFQMVRTFLIVTYGGFFDIAPGFRGAFDMMARTLADHHVSLAMDQLVTLGLGKWDFIILAVGALVIWFLDVRLEHRNYEEPGELLQLHAAPVQWLVLLLTILVIAVLGVYGPGYNPADFVYMQF